MVLALSGPVQAQPGPVPQGAPRVEVGVVRLHPQSVAITAELPGRTTASLTAEVRPQVSGIVRERLFKEGGEVAAGDLLYQIDPASYKAAFDSAVATLQKARAAVPSAETKVERYQTLIRQNAVAKQDLDDAAATLAQAQAAVAVAEADLATARINLDYTSVRAPIGGRIDKSSLTPGALVTAGQTTVLTTIRTIDPINVDIIQSSRRLLDLTTAIAAGKVRIAGDNVRVKLKLENGAIYAQTGTLAFAEANVNQTTGTYTLRAQFPNPERLLLPGTYVRAIVEEGIAENSFLVPQRAVGHNSKGQATALFVDKDDKVQERVLQVADAIGNSWRVQEGIADDDRVIVEGSQRARPGSVVRTVEVVIDDRTGEVVQRKEGASTGQSTTDVATSDGRPRPTAGAN
ncbi:efflux RND transporter periplasmic adaptor subunit [Siculibacillus lacustris]|uniref:efflux RND transporter periplasmic adaptor subunit n=1 Tax=Siculibacillus lacustris TaxID=1549641 RepID=UPI00389A0C8B